jgi:hypothetical protein
VTADQVRKILARRIAKTNLSAWCREKGVNRPHASEFVNGKGPPPSDVLAALGFEWRIVRTRPLPRD